MIKLFDGNRLEKEGTCDVRDRIGPLFVCAVPRCFLQQSDMKQKQLPA